MELTSLPSGTSNLSINNIQLAAGHRESGSDHDEHLVVDESLASAVKRRVPAKTGHLKMKIPGSHTIIMISLL